MPETVAVVGKNYGDEGKGLAVSELARQCPSLIIKHNGGAQAGHTAEGPFGRFVFHQLGAGSFHRAETLYVRTFLLDLYQLGKEYADFRALSGFAPALYADPETPVSFPDDVLINMALETVRGEQRHGSCGMGIYEAQLRAETGCTLTVGEVYGMNAEALYRRLRDIRTENTERRVAEAGLKDRCPAEYAELLRDDRLLRGAAEAMRRNTDLLTLRMPEPGWLILYEQIIFEGAQGLLLDAEYVQGQPHVTASRTGLIQPAAFCRRYGLCLDRVLYVTRSYITRHGAGPLPYECAAEALGRLADDRTNTPNPWQGAIRYARHPELPEFLAPIADDLAFADIHPEVNLLVTHLNETADQLCFVSGNLSLSDFRQKLTREPLIDHIYSSRSPENIDWRETVC